MPRGDIDSLALLEGIKDNEFKELLVIAIDEAGEFYIASTNDNLDKANMLLDMAKEYIIGHACNQTPGIRDIEQD